MAKNDDARTRTMLGSEGDRTKGILTGLGNQFQGQNNSLWGNYNKAVDKQSGDYDSAMSGYKGFADNGGFTPDDVSAMRSRVLSPIRSVYANANREVDRQRSLQGGYAPGFLTAKARMAREMGQSASDASTNVEASLAGLRQQGRLAGLGGMSNLYSASPGMVNAFGNQALASNQQQLGLAGLENQRMGTILGTQLGLTQAPGKFKSAMGNIGSALDVGGGFGKLISGF